MPVEREARRRVPRQQTLASEVTFSGVGLHTGARVRCSVHPAPDDHWRWTHTGLERLFGRNGEWESVTVLPAGGIATCLSGLTGIYANLLFRRARLGLLGRGIVWLLNTAGAALDRRFAGLREPRPGSIFLNFHVRADKAS